jgi:hypothetical protein
LLRFLRRFSTRIRIVKGRESIRIEPFSSSRLKASASLASSRFWAAVSGLKRRSPSSPSGAFLPRAEAGAGVV